jgi:hypothetical protein
VLFVLAWAVLVALAVALAFALAVADGLAEAVSVALSVGFAAAAGVLVLFELAEGTGAGLLDPVSFRRPSIFAYAVAPAPAVSSRAAQTIDMIRRVRNAPLAVCAQGVRRVGMTRLRELQMDRICAT